MRCNQWRYSQSLHTPLPAHLNTLSDALLLLLHQLLFDLSELGTKLRSGLTMLSQLSLADRTLLLELGFVLLLLAIRHLGHSF